MRLRAFDQWLLSPRPMTGLPGPGRFAVEFLFFGLKEARACLFVVLFFAAVFSLPRAGVFGVPRYDALLFLAVAIQGWMVWARLETEVPKPAGRLVHGPRRKVEFVVAAGDHDLHHRREPQARQSTHPRSRVTGRAAGRDGKTWLER